MMTAAFIHHDDVTAMFNSSCSNICIFMYTFISIFMNISRKYCTSCFRIKVHVGNPFIWSMATESDHSTGTQFYAILVMRLNGAIS